MSEKEEENLPLPRFAITHRALAPFDAIANIIGEVGITFDDHSLHICGKTCESNFIFTWTISGFDFTHCRTKDVYVGVEPAVLKVAVGKMTKTHRIEMRVAVNHAAMEVRHAEHEGREHDTADIFCLEVLDKFGGVKRTESLDVENFRILDFQDRLPLMRPMSVEHLHSVVDSITPMKIGFIEGEGLHQDSNTFTLRASGHGILNMHMMRTLDEQPFVGDPLCAFYYVPYLKCLTKIFNHHLTSSFLFSWAGEVLMITYVLDHDPLTSVFSFLIASTERRHVPKGVQKRRNVRAQTPEPKRTLREHNEWGEEEQKEENRADTVKRARHSIEHEEDEDKVVEEVEEWYEYEGEE